MREFTYQALAGRVVFGAGVVRRRLADELDVLGTRRLLLIVSARTAPLARELTARVAAWVAGSFTGVRQHVPVEAADEARAAALEIGADAVLCLGGGSTIGTAKAVALTTRLPIIAIPTTFAGSEVTPVWGLTEKGRKTTGTDLTVLPRVVVYDPELTASMPPRLVAASGFNALAHCVEAFWAPGRNPVSSVLAEEGIRSLREGLEAVSAGTPGLEGHGQALFGAYLAGTAFASAGAGLHHKICHVLGGTYELPHAETHAVLLPHVVAFNAAGTSEAAVRVGRALGADSPGDGLRDLADRLDLPRSLREIGFGRADIPEAARLIHDAVPVDNPRPVTTNDLERLLLAAWVGEAA